MGFFKTGNSRATLSGSRVGAFYRVCRVATMNVSRSKKHCQDCVRNRFFAWRTVKKRFLAPFPVWHLFRSAPGERIRFRLAGPDLKVREFLRDCSGQ